MIRASWASGLGAVPLGYSSYCPNSIESAHKALKRSLGGKPAHRNVGQLLKQVPDAVKSKADMDFYRNLVSSVDSVPEHLIMIRWPRKKNQRLLPESVEEAAQTERTQARRVPRRLFWFKSFNLSMSVSCVFPRASERRVLMKWNLSIHLHIFTSSHPHIFKC